MAKKGFNIDFGIKQNCTNNEKCFSHAYKCFGDINGHFITVLSDSVDKEENAVCEGRKAIEVIAQSVENGIEYDKALNEINTILLDNEVDEFIVLVDITDIDLETGNTKIYKAGSAPSFLLRNGKLKKIESNSLPAGILKEISFDVKTVKCKAGDMFLSLSDAAIKNGCDWIKDCVASFEKGNAQDFADFLYKCICDQNNNCCAEDITVLCFIFDKTY